MTRSAAGGRRSPRTVEFKTKPELGVELVERAAGWEIAKAPVLGDQAYGDNTALRERLHDSGLQYVLSVGADTKVFAPETTFTVPDPQGGAGRSEEPAAARPRAGRDRAADRRARRRSSPRPSPSATGPTANPSPRGSAFVRVRAANHAKKRTPWPPREEWLIAEWPEDHEPADRLLDLEPPRRHRARAARPARSAALEDRARLQTAQGRARPRPLRGTLLARLAPPHRPRHRRPRLPHPGAPKPKSPAAGLTLPQAVLLLQPVFKCWTGRCRTCHQPINLDDLPLHQPPQHE